MKVYGITYKVFDNGSCTEYVYASSAEQARAGFVKDCEFDNPEIDQEIISVEEVTDEAVWESREVLV